MHLIFAISCYWKLLQIMWLEYTNTIMISCKSRYCRIPLTLMMWGILHSWVKLFWSTVPVYCSVECVSRPVLTQLHSKGIGHGQAKRFHIPVTCSWLGSLFKLFCSRVAGVHCLITGGKWWACCKICFEVLFTTPRLQSVPLKKKMKWRKES